jgi:nucleotidyltransferase-like protein
VAWSYAEPLPAVAAIAGHMAFFNERVDIEVDGVEQDRGPSTQWSTTNWIERARVPA